MATGELRRKLRAAAPNLVREVDALVEEWLGQLLAKVRSDRELTEFRPKQINDPIWGTVELLPWEVALLDSPLLQRMRGVKQLGLAPLVFPSASHDRLEHILGVVGATERMLHALGQQIERWNRDNQTAALPTIELKDRYALRLAALLHDIGHGSFSHALEPVLEPQSVLLEGDQALEGADWRKELILAQASLAASYARKPAPSEVIAALMVFSEPMLTVLGSDKIFTARGRTGEDLLECIVAAIIGGAKGPGTTYLSAVVSSQIDADKLDYLARDAHHAGLEIGFDTDRLLSRLEVLRVTGENVDASAIELRERASKAPEKMFLQIGIAASGFGSFEQMLIGRTFLYDRLYHHHKVRSAEAMAQRMMLVAERDRKRRFDLGEIFMRVGDDTLLRIVSGEVKHKRFTTDSAAAASLARRILDRELLHRAFAFRGRLISAPPGMPKDAIDTLQQVMWRRIVKQLDTLGERYAIGKEIHALAVTCAEELAAGNIEKDAMEQYLQALKELGPEHIIVDLPELKAGAIQILARFPNGALKVPEFSFNPVKWSNAYELQKRTGYVFCPREVLPIVALSSRIVFLIRFGVVMSPEAEGYIKAGTAVSGDWLPALVDRKVIDRLACEALTAKRFSLLQVTEEDLKVPQGWLEADPDIAIRFAQGLNANLKGGLTAEHLQAFGRVMQALYALIDNWFLSHRVTLPLEDEGKLQRHIKDCFGLQKLKVTEGSVVGGGELDLFLEDAILVENKFHRSKALPEKASPAAGMQGRRYAIALDSQVVVVLLAYQPKAGEFQNKVESIEIKTIRETDVNRVEVRVSLPYGAVRPSDEAAEKR